MFWHWTCQDICKSEHKYWLTHIIIISVTLFVWPCHQRAVHVISLHRTRLFLPLSTKHTPLFSLYRRISDSYTLYSTISPSLLALLAAYGLAYSQQLWRVQAHSSARRFLSVFSDSCGCLRTELRGSDSEWVYIGYGWPGFATTRGFYQGAAMA